MWCCPPPRANHIAARCGRPPRARPLPRFAVAAHVGGGAGGSRTPPRLRAPRFAGKPFGPRYGWGGATHRPALDVGRVPHPPVSAVDAARVHSVVGCWCRTAAVGLPHSIDPQPVIVVEPFSACHPHRSCLSPLPHYPGRPLTLRAPDTSLFGPSPPAIMPASAAFVGAATAGSLTRARAGPAVTCRTSRTAVAGTPLRWRRRQPVVAPAAPTGPVAQYNYNIYQDSSDRSKRTVGADDRTVSIRKPLGLILEESQDGMVFVAEIDPEGNAAEEEDLSVGDIVVAVSATFGDEVWSTRGVGLDRVMKSIKVRSGPFVTLVLETPDQLAAKKVTAMANAADRRDKTREKFGSPEVLNPVSWTKQQESKGAVYDYSKDAEPSTNEIEAELKEKLRNEITAPYRQNWLLWISGGVFALVIISFIVLN